MKTNHRLLCLVLAAAGFMPVAAQGRPQLKVVNPAVDVGAVIRGETGEARFELKNLGTAPLRITDTKARCACTLADYDEVIAPGDSGFVNVRVDTTEMRGAVGRKVIVYTDDPRAKQVSLTVNLVVLTSVAVLPAERLALSNSTEVQGVSRSGELLVRKEGTEQGQLEVTNLQGSAPWVVATATRIEADRPVTGTTPRGRPGDWLITVDFVGQASPGTRWEEVTFETGLAREPVMTIPVSVHYVPPIVINSDRLVLPEEKATTGDSVMFTVRRGLDPERLTISSTPESLVYELDRVGDRHFKMHVRFVSPNETRGTIVFRIGEEPYRIDVFRGADQAGGESGASHQGVTGSASSSG